MLSCSCNEWDGEGWYYMPEEDFGIINSNKRKRCKSCKCLIGHGELALKFNRYRGCNTDIERKIYCEDVGVPIAPWYHCEKCGEQFMNLDALGYCLNIQDNMLECLAEYRKRNE